MYRIFLSFVFVLTLTLPVACSDQQQITDNNIFCDNQPQYVCDGTTLKICGANGTWAYETCASVCEQMGLVSAGCAFNESKGYDFCNCEDACCESGKQRCSGDTLQYCVECQWVETDCADYCEEKGSTSTGCGTDESIGNDPVCLCEDKGNAICSDNHVKCQEGYVNICNEQLLFTAVSCREKCEEAGYYYSYCDVNAEDVNEDCHCTAEIEDSICATSQPACNGENSVDVCEGGEINTYDCDKKCEALGLISEGCKADKDRGHDACFCNEK